MKTIYTLLFTLLFAAQLQATTITAVVNNGQWDVNSTWDLNRQPLDNDTIYIPVGFTIILDQHISLNSINLFINGTLRFLGGKLTLNNVSTILIQSGGKIIGTNNSEQIRLGDIFKYKGEEGTISGPALANAVSGDGFLSLTLPVKFIDFTVKRNAGKNELTWVTSEEINNSHFEIQRSEDGQHWKNIAMIFATATPGPVNRYTYADIFNSTANIYYRLKQVDNDSRYSYSAIKTINGNELAVIATIYTCARNTIAIKFNEQTIGSVFVRIINVSGQFVREQHITLTTHQIKIQMPIVTPGVYTVQVFTANNKSAVKKVIL